MIKQRVPKTERDLKKIEDNFIKSVDVTSLSDLSLDDLANRYYEIHCQSHLMKGLILLEARNRFASNNEFGEWIQSVQSICLDAQPVRTRLMNYAKYFKEKDITGISLSACYEISAPVNEDVADKVYEYALNKNLSVSDIKATIKEEKKRLPVLESNAEHHDQESFTETDHDTGKKEELMPREDVSDFVKLILSDIQSLPQNEAVRVLKLCLKELNKHSVTEGIADAKL